MSWGPVDVVKDFLRQQSVAALSNTYGISKHDVEEMLRDAIRSPVKWADAPSPAQGTEPGACLACNDTGTRMYGGGPCRNGCKPSAPVEASGEDRSQSCDSTRCRSGLAPCPNCGPFTAGRAPGGTDADEVDRG